MSKTGTSQIDDRIKISVFTNVENTDGGSTYLGIYAEVKGHPIVRICIPPELATERRKINAELLRANLQFYEASLLEKKLRGALEFPSSAHEKVATRTGWHGTSFVHNGEVFCGTEGAGFFVHQDLRRMHIPYPSDPEDKLIDYIVANAPKSDFIAAATMIAFAQPLIGMLSAAERPVIYIWGESRTGKTTIGKLINALVRPPSDRALKLFDSTPRAFEETLASSSDSVAVFDELTGVDDRELERRLSPFIYLSAGGVGKSRSIGANFRDLCWRTTAVITGERDIDTLASRKKGSGQDARLITLRVPSRDEGGIWKDEVTIEERAQRADEFLQLINDYMDDDYVCWLRYIVRNRDKVSKRFKRNVQHFLRQLVPKDADSLNRARALHFAHLAAAGMELSKWGYFKWGESLPFDVVSRLYQTNATSLVEKPDYSQARNFALEISARLAFQRIPHGTTDEKDVGAEAFTCLKKKVRWLMIKREFVAKYAGGPAQDVMKAFRECGFVIQKPGVTTPWFQRRKYGSGEYYLRVKLSDIEGLVLPTTSDT